MPLSDSRESCVYNLFLDTGASRTYNETRHLVPAIAEPGHKKHSTRKEKPWHSSKN